MSFNKQNFNNSPNFPNQQPNGYIDPSQLTTLQYKIILIGDGGTGKTTYITRVKEGMFTREYVATVGAVVSDLEFITNTNHHLKFQVWDTAGQELNSMLSDIYYMEANAAIIMFDVTSRVTFKNIKLWLRKLRNLTTINNNPIPVIVCGNKVDCKDRKVKHEQISEARTKDVYKYVEISAKSNFNFEKPFLYIARALLNNSKVEFITNINLKPAEINIEEANVYESQSVIAMVEQAQQLDLPDDDN